MRPAGRPGNSSPIGRRVCNWRRYRTSRATGRLPKMTKELMAAVMFCTRSGGSATYRNSRARAVVWEASIVDVVKRLGPISSDHGDALVAGRDRPPTRICPTGKYDSRNLPTYRHTAFCGQTPVIMFCMYGPYYPENQS